MRVEDKGGHHEPNELKKSSYQDLASAWKLKTSSDDPDFCSGRNYLGKNAADILNSSVYRLVYRTESSIDAFNDG